MKPNWFVAAPVETSWLPNLLSDLPQTCRGFTPEDIHMTVAFFGAMDPKRADDVILHMKSIRRGSFSITLGKLIPLPSPKRCSALSLAVDEGQEEAAALIGDLRDPMIQIAGGRPDTRPPLPHITVARPIRKYREQGRRDALAWAHQAVAPSTLISISKLALYTWHEDRPRRQFQIVYEMPLAERD